MAMAAPSTSTAVAVAASDLERPRLGGIEALKLNVGPVRRNLFGPVDHCQLQKDFERLLCLSVEGAKKRWSFDFQSDRPVQGSAMEWEELRCQDVPKFYRSCTVKRAARPAGRPMKTHRWSSSSSGDDSPPSGGSSPASGDEYLEVTTRGYYRLQLPSKRTQPSITDFFKVKKRRLLHYKGSSRQ